MGSACMYCDEGDENHAACIAEVERQRAEERARPTVAQLTERLATATLALRRVVAEAERPRGMWAAPYASALAVIRSIALAALSEPERAAPSATDTKVTT